MTHPSTSNSVIMDSARVEMRIHEALYKRELISSYSPGAFRRDLQASSRLIQRLQLLHILEGHDGCVNTIQFTGTGENVITGSDDTAVKLFNVASGKQVLHIPTFHTNNIFYAKDLPSDGDDTSWLVTCAADGRVGLINMHTRNCRLLFRHRGRAHRLALMPSQPQQFLSCGEDGYVCLFDIRDKTQRIFANPPDQEMLSIIQANALPSLTLQLRLQDRRSPVSIYGIGSNPGNSNEIAVAGSCSKVAIFDLRSPARPLRFLCPQHLEEDLSKHITGLKYSYNGELIVASYSDEKVYTFFSSGAPPPSSPSSSSSALPAASVTANSTAGVTAEDERTAGPESTSRRLHLARKCMSRVLNSCFGYGSVPTSSSSPSSMQAAAEDESAAYSTRGYFQCYSGHRNCDTVKQINFLGSRSEFVVSGSDCGHIFVWDTATARVLKVLRGDHVGAVNSLSAHPSLPILATSGLESAAKLWAPVGEYDAVKEQERVRQVVQSNAAGGRRRGPVLPRYMMRALMGYMAQRQPEFDLLGLEDDSSDGSGGEPARQRRRLAAIFQTFFDAAADNVDSDVDSDVDNDDDEDDEEDDEEDDNDDEGSYDDDGDSEEEEDEEEEEESDRDSGREEEDEEEVMGNDDGDDDGDDDNDDIDADQADSDKEEESWVEMDSERERSESSQDGDSGVPDPTASSEFFDEL